MYFSFKVHNGTADFGMSHYILQEGIYKDMDYILLYPLYIHLLTPK